MLRTIGVSNFGIPHLEKLAQSCSVSPAVNQIELHPWLQRTELVEYCRSKGMVLEVGGCWSVISGLGHLCEGNRRPLEPAVTPSNLGLYSVLIKCGGRRCFQLHVL